MIPAIKVAMHLRVRMDYDKMRRAAEKAGRRSLMREGALIRGIARRSIRYRREGVHAPPGHPPYSHVQSGTMGVSLKSIYFKYLDSERAVIVGPVGLGSYSRAPHVQEFGGTVTVRGRKGKKRRVRIAARPYMSAALREARPKLAKPWKASVRG